MNTLNVKSHIPTGSLVPVAQAMASRPGTQELAQPGGPHEHDSFAFYERSEFMDTLSQCSALKSVDLSGLLQLQDGSDGTQPSNDAHLVATFLSRVPLLERIILRQCSIGPLSLEIILKGIQNRPPAFLPIVLDIGDNAIGNAGMRTLAAHVAQPSCRILELDITLMVETEDPYTGEICEAFATNTSIRKLTSGQNLWIVPFLPSLANSQSLLSLSLPDINFRKQNIDCLLQIMLARTGIIHLFLERCFGYDEWDKALQMLHDTLKKNLYILHLELSEIGPSGELLLDKIDCLVQRNSMIDSFKHMKPRAPPEIWQESIARGVMAQLTRTTSFVSENLPRAIGLPPEICSRILLFCACSNFPVPRASFTEGTAQIVYENARRQLAGPEEKEDNPNLYFENMFATCIRYVVTRILARLGIFTSDTNVELAIDVLMAMPRIGFNFVARLIDNVYNFNANLTECGGESGQFIAKVEQSCIQHAEKVHEEALKKKRQAQEKNKKRRQAKARNRKKNK